MANALELEDHCQIRKKSKKSQLGTAERHFSNFLRQINGMNGLNGLPEVSCLADMPADATVMMKYLGTFSDYLHKQVKSIRKMKSHEQYVSNIFGVMIRKHPTLTSQMELRYTDLRKTVQDIYVQASITNGTPLVDRTEEMNLTDFRYINHYFLETNNFVGRCAFNLGYTYAGRISENLNCKWTYIREYSETDIERIKRYNLTGSTDFPCCPYTIWLRPKTTNEYEYLALMPSPYFEMCVIHALACHACLTACAQNDLFISSISNAAINDMFRNAYQHWELDSSDSKPPKYTKGLTSHSLRVLGKNVLSSNPFIKQEWQALREGVSDMDRLRDSRLTYLHEKWAFDAPCARVLSLWNSVRECGKCCTLGINHSL